MTSQDTEALKALVELAKKATPGPAEVLSYSPRSECAIVRGTKGENHPNVACMESCSIIDGKEAEANAVFYAAARNFDLKGLQTQYEAMREWIKGAEHKTGCSADGQYIALGYIACECGLSALRASLDTKARGDGE